jgi:hypothetical protein
MFFLSKSERDNLKTLLHANAGTEGLGLDDRHVESDAHLVFEGLHVLANGYAARLYAMLHPHGHKSHPDANGGRTLLIMQKIEEGGSGAVG